MNTVMLQAFVNEMTKLAEAKLAVAPPVAGAAAAAKKQPFLVRNAKPIGLMALGAGGYAIGQDIVNDYRTGRMMRRQNEAAQSMF